jgi:hypothetical protein
VPGNVRQVQFAERLSENDLTKLGRELHRRPEIALRAYGYSGPTSYTDLDFLYYFPNIRNLEISLWSLTNLDGLRAIRNLDSFTFGATKTKRHSLAFLTRFSTLRKLYIEGHTKEIRVLSELGGLEQLTLRCVSLPNLKLLMGLGRLRTVEILFGGTTNLEALQHLPRLNYLDLTWIRKLEDVSIIGNLKHLEGLHLQALRNVTKLPSFRDLRSLRAVYLEAMRGLSNLQAIADAPALEGLYLQDLPKLDPSSLRCFVGHPTLRAFHGGLGGMKRNAEAEALLGLPPTQWSAAGAREKAALEIMTQDAIRAVN